MGRQKEHRVGIPPFALNYSFCAPLLGTFSVPTSPSAVGMVGGQRTCSGALLEACASFPVALFPWR